MASETALVRRVLRELNSWPNTHAVKMHGSPYGVRGRADIWGCRYGRMFLLEMKSPGKKPKKLQAKELERWGRAGAVTGWYDTFEGAIDRIRSIDSSGR
jgi:hypothetical protein